MYYPSVLPPYERVLLIKIGKLDYYQIQLEGICVRVVGLLEAIDT